MSNTPLRYFTVVLLSGFFLSARCGYGLSPRAGGSPQALSSAHLNDVYPQIVRVSYVEGDVRVLRGKAAQKTTGALWEKAVTGLPLEAGFSVVTAKGRAEIEFEDASTVYLGENSVLVCNDLSTTGGVPRTDLGLLSGVATEDVQPMVAGEFFFLRTPTDTLTVGYPRTAFVRVNSYLDAMALTAQDDATFPVHGLGATWKGKTVAFNHSRRVDGAAVPDAAASVEWDGWVMGRVEQRKAAMAAMMKESGLAEPVPGLAELQGQGKFFACEPYGTCWEPTNGWGGKEMLPPPQVERNSVAVEDAREAAPLRMDVVDRLPAVSRGSDGGAEQMAEPVKRVAQVNPAGPLVDQNGDILSMEDGFFPCSPWQVRYLIATDPLTRRQTIIGSEDYLEYPWEWAVCHTGSWIRHEHRYAWVPGRKRHHHRPVRWVKYASRKGYVPIHPRDVAGKPPVNLKYGLFVAAKNGIVERVGFNPERPVKLLAEAPKEFRRAYFPALARAEVPRMEARTLAVEKTSEEAAGKEMPGKQMLSRTSEVPITFDRKTQSFSVARQVMEGGRTTTVAQGFASAQPRAGGGFDGARGGGAMASAGRSGGGSSGGYSRASSGGGAEASHSAPAASAPSGGGASSGGAAAAGSRK
jgi:hypothetical protein